SRAFRVRCVCVGNATYAFPVLIQHCVCQCIGRWTQLPFYFRAVEVDDHHTRWRQQVIGHTAGFDGEDTEVTVGRADISECMNDKTQTREIHVCLVRRFFYVIEFRHAKTRESITCAIRGRVANVYVPTTCRSADTFYIAFHSVPPVGYQACTPHRIPDP